MQLIRVAKQTSKRFVSLFVASITAFSGLSLAAPLLIAGNASAATRDVCASGCTYTTIQSAVNAATSGDTITVAPGTYAETVTVNKDIALVGAQPGVAGNLHSGSESNVTEFDVSAGGVTIDGFSITRVGINSPTKLSGLLIENNVFSGYGEPSIPGGVALPTYNAGNINIQNNYFINPGGYGEAMQIKADDTTASGCDDTQVLNNVFDAATNNGGADINFSCTGSHSANVTVTGNTSIGNSGGSSLVAFSGVDSGIVVSGNTATTSGSTVFFFGNVSGAVSINSNHFTNGAGNGVAIYGGDAGTTDSQNSGTFSITNNSLSNNHLSAIKLSANALTGAGKVIANNNDLSGSGSGIAVNNLSTGSVDATNNYWGNATPDFGTLISGSNVTHDPYYINSERSHLNNDPSPGVVYVDGSYTSSSAGGHEFGWDAFSTIQAGIDAVASGGIVHVGAGTYDSFSVSGKTGLTIEGSGVGSTVVAPTSLVASGLTHKYTTNMKVSVLVNNSSNITISGMTIKDNGMAPGLDGPDALVLWNASSGSLSNASLDADYTINGAQTGQGIALDASGSQNAALTVSNTTISGFQKNGIDAINGNGATSGTTGTVTLNVDSSTITGAGSTGTIAQNGVVLWDRGGGTLSGTVSDSTISGFKYTPLNIPDGDNGTGILTYGGSASVNVSNSTLSDSDLDAANATSGGTFTATHNFWGPSPDFSAIIGQVSDGYGPVSYAPYYLDAGLSTLSNNAYLTSLSLSSGSLSPSFSSSTMAYSASVANSVSSVTPSYVANAGSSVSVNGTALSAGQNNVTVTVTSADGTATKTYTVTVTRASATQTVPDSGGNATVNSSTPQVVVSDPSQSLNITVSSGTTGAGVNYSPLVSHGATTSTATLPQTVIQTSNAQVSIPASTVVTATDPSWNGVITAPQVLTNTSVPVTTPSGYTTTVGTVIKVGSDTADLSFDAPVQIVIPNQAGQLVGFVRNGVFTQISEACSTSAPAIGELTANASGACHIDSGSDMVVWTSHFTEFITYSQTATPSGGGSNSGGSSSGSGSSSSSGGTTTTSSSSGSSTGNSGGVQAASNDNGGKTSSTNTNKPAVASLAQPKVAAKEANGGGLRWYWLVLIAVASLCLAAMIAYRYAEGTDRN